MERAWLQKHPTPASADGDFHWYPADGDPSLRATIAAEAAAEPGTLTLWLSPGRAIAARRFSAVAPADGRRYLGLAVATADTLSALSAPPAAPWRGGQGTAAAGAEVQGTAAGVAAMWRGGHVSELGLAEAARVEAWLPSEIRTVPRRIVVGLPDDELGALGPVARWLAGAIATHGAARIRAQRAWRAVQALARVEGRDVAAQVAQLAALDDAWASAAGVRAYLAAAGIVLPARLHVPGDGRAQWARALHGWGRGWVDRTDALASVLARRGVADRLVDAPARRWRRILRHEALVPAARADELERAVRSRLPALEEDHDA